MNISMQLTVVVVAACLCLADSAPDGRLVRKQQRPTRGFKNVEMMTARGFGKRDRPHTRTERDTHSQHELPSGTDRTGRSTPTFKSPTVNIARDFGKRAPELENEAPFAEASARRKFDPKNSLMVAYDFGKRSNDFSDEVVDMDDFLEALASPEKDGQDIEDKTESMPLELLVLEMMNNPDFTRSVVRKFIDVNQDGMLSLDELLRNVA